jgi:hypothetical protein
MQCGGMEGPKERLIDMSFVGEPLTFKQEEDVGNLQSFASRGQRDGGDIRGGCEQKSASGEVFASERDERLRSLLLSEALADQIGGRIGFDISSMEVTGLITSSMPSLL